MTAESNPAKTFQRSSAGLRDALFDTIERVRAGTMQAEDAKAIVGVSREICETVRLEVEVAKFHRDAPERANEVAPSFLPLIGSDKGDEPA